MRERVCCTPFITGKDGGHITAALEHADHVYRIKQLRSMLVKPLQPLNNRLIDLVFHEIAWMQHSGR